MAGSLSYFNRTELIGKTAFGKVQRGTRGCFDPLFLCVVSHYFSICFWCFNLLLNTFNHFVSHLHICPHSAGLSPPVSSFSPFFCGQSSHPSHVEEVAKCPGCSLNIGGRDHNQTEHTFQDDESAAWSDGWWVSVGMWRMWIGVYFRCFFVSGCS